MNQSHHTPAPPSEPAWDITFTRLTHAVQPLIEAGAFELERRFGAIGLRGETQVKPTPRGWSAFLALVGQRSLICIVDLTLIDGMAVGLGPCAELDIRLLDACGDVVEDGLFSGRQRRTFHETWTGKALISENLDRAMTATYVATLAQFDLLQHRAGHA
jgi:hypothetical protein